MMLGVHCSVSGGLEHAFDEAALLHLDTFQVLPATNANGKQNLYWPKKKQLLLMHGKLILR